MGYTQAEEFPSGKTGENLRTKKENYTNNISLQMKGIMNPLSKDKRKNSSLWRNGN